MSSSSRLPVADHRRRTTTSLLWLLALSWAVFAVLSYVLARPWVGHMQAAAGVITAVAAWVSAPRTAKHTIPVHVSVAVGAATLSLIAMLTGQSESVSWWYLLLLPVVVSQTIGARAAIVWGSIGVGLIAAIVASERVVVLEPLATFGPVERAAGPLMICALLIAYMIYIKRLAESSLAAAAERERTIGIQASELETIRDELALARDQAVDASNAKTALMARVSHELRTPLNGLFGLSEVLAEGSLEPAQAEIARTLRSSAAALRQLVEDLLDVTRIEGGHLSVHPEPTEVRELVGEVLDTFASVAERKGLSLAAVVAPDVPETLKLDTLRVRQVVSNLVSNALKFTTKGEVVVEVDAKGVESTSLRISVRDTGPGIDDDQKAQLFERFTQLEGPLELRRQGAGLGLWIARQLAHAMGGGLEVNSTPGRGSVFRLVIEVGRVTHALPRSSGLLVAGARVLVVDPHAASRRAITSLAEHFGFPLRACESVEAARAALAEEGADVILLDAAMGGPVERSARRLRQDSPGARLVLAASPSHAVAHRTLPRGFAAVTLKPYRASRVRGVILDVLSDEGPEDAGPEVVPARSLRCLVVDDDPTNRMVARLLLRRAGHDVVLASDARSAFERVAWGALDVVLLDVHMPGESGIALARRIRSELDPTKRLWIIALTAATSEEERQACKDAGMDDFLAKPVEVGLLRAALERSIRGLRRRGRSSSQVLPALTFDKDTFDALMARMGPEGPLMVSEYVDNGTKLVSQLRSALSKHDVETARRAVHTLASSSLLMGATGLGKLSRDFEARLEGEEEATPIELDALVQSFEAIAIKLRNHLRD